MSGTARADIPQLIIAEQKFTGWTDLKVTRGIARMATDFQMHVAGGWPGADAGWPIRSFAPCAIRIDDDPVMAGYIDGIEATLEAEQLTIRVDGRSKTADIIDCHALIDGGEFRDSTFAAICRAVAAPFGIEVQDTANVGRVVIPTEAADQTEACFKFLERLARQASVLLTDDAQGRLVIARTSANRCSSEIVKGSFLSATMTMQVEKRFDRYIVKSQLPTSASWISEFARRSGEGREPGGDAQPAITGEIRDTAVPRYRPFVMQAEGNADAAQARARALWQSRRDAAASLVMKVLVQGWRQADARLWQINELIQVDLPDFGVREEMLVATVTHSLDKNGRRTLLTLGLPEAFTPEPADPAKTAGRSGSGSWIQQLPRGGGNAA